MRAFENLLSTIVCFGLILAALHRLDPRLTISFAIAALIALVFHLVQERPRWQMVPVYLAFAIFLATFAAPSSILLWLCVGGVLAILAGEAVNFLLPMFRFEPTTGPYLTGTSIHHLTHVTRSDDSPSGHRELMVQLWYPAAGSKKPLASYRRAAETTRVSSYQSLLRTRSRLDAPIAKSSQPYPVLLFNPAWNGRRTQNTFLTEELASHGYVVAAIDHTGNSEPIAFPDGRIVYATHIRDMEDVSISTPQEIQRIGNTEVDRQALDCRFVLDELTRWNQQQGSPWHQVIDTTNAGALGHSLGGAVSIETWATDPRVRAAVNMDGWTFGSQASTGQRKSFPASTGAAPDKPLLFIYEGNHNEHPSLDDANGKSETEKRVDIWDAEHVHQLLQHHGGYWLKIAGADHANFTDRTLSSPLRRLAGGGSIKPKRAHRILCLYAVNFFHQALRGRSSTLLEFDTGRYPEISATTYPPTPETVTPTARKARRT